MKNNPLHIKPVYALAIIFIWQCLASAAFAEATVQTINPPVKGFFAKYVDCGGIPVRSSAVVEDNALLLACNKVATMLQYIPRAKQALMLKGAELHIIGQNEQTSDLPEFRDQRDVVYTDNHGHQTTIDKRTRGKGGLLSSCGEENILQLPNDRYRGGSVCIHEFAHAIMDIGFNQAQRQQIQDQYAKSMQAGLWKNAYAATNAKEFWAELSVWFFATHGDTRMEGTPPADGPDGLRAYDPDAYALLYKLYSGNG